MEEFMLKEAVVVLCGIIALVFGILVLCGNERWFRMLAGGRYFLSLDPDGPTLDKAAKQSGIMIILIGAVLLCAAAWYAADSLRASPAIITLTTFCGFFFGALAAIAALVTIVSQTRMIVRLRK